MARTTIARRNRTSAAAPDGNAAVFVITCVPQEYANQVTSQLRI